jgi:hypothetical protein
VCQNSQALGCLDQRRLPDRFWGQSEKFYSQGSRLSYFLSPLFSACDAHQLDLLAIKHGLTIPDARITRLTFDTLDLYVSSLLHGRLVSRITISGYGYHSDQRIES